MSDNSLIDRESNSEVFWHHSSKMLSIVVEPSIDSCGLDLLRTGDYWWLAQLSKSPRTIMMAVIMKPLLMLHQYVSLKATA